MTSAAPAASGPAAGAGERAPAHMRVAYLVGRYPAVSHTFILREVLALRERGVEVEPISINRPTAADTLAEADRREAERTYGILPPRWGTVVRTHLRAALTRPAAYARTLAAALRLARPGLRGRLYGLFYFAEAVLVWARCREVGVRHIHVHHLNQASNAAMLAIELEGKGRDGRPRWTWSYTMHGPDELTDVTLFRLAEKARSAAAIACISDFARSQVMAVLDEPQWRKLRVVHCGLVPEEFAPGPAREGDERDLRVLFVGRMVAVKGQHVLLAALAQLAADGVAVRATFIGEGPLRAVVAARARDLGLGARVEVLGAVGQDDIRRHFAEADVFVLPSFAEGLPVVLIEAMAMELPVISTTVAGIPELVRHGVSGLLVPPGRADRVAEAIAELSASPERRREMGRRGRETIVAEFDVRRSAAELEAMFAEVLAA